MTIKLREGGVYLTREGKKVGPITRRDHRDHPIYNWTDGVHNWMDSGRYVEGWKTCPIDLISEVTESPSPVRKVTRTEIVPGTYGRLLVDGTVEPRGADRAIRANVTLVDLGGQPSGDWRVFLDPSELRSAASIFTELADALDAMANEEK